MSILERESFAQLNIISILICVLISAISLVILRNLKTISNSASPFAIVLSPLYVMNRLPK